MKDIPIKNTKEAIIYGQSMNQKMMKEMKRGQKFYYTQTQAAIREKRWEDASKMAFKSQLCREAVEAFNGTLKLRNQ